MPIEVETPVATAAIKGTEFNIQVQPDGKSTLTVIEGLMEFGTPFGTCPIRTSTVSFGEGGNGTTADSSVPVTVSGITNAVAMATGYNYTCAILADGRVWCWENTEGQVGNGSISSNSALPGIVSNLAKALVTK